MKLKYFTLTSGQNIIGKLAKECEHFVDLQDAVLIGIAQAQDGKAYPVPMPPIPGVNEENSIRVWKNTIAIEAMEIPGAIEKLYHTIVSNIVLPDSDMKKIILNESNES